MPERENKGFLPGNEDSSEVSFPVPYLDFEVGMRSRETAEILISDPSQIGIFRKNINDRFFLAETSRDDSQVERLEKYLGYVSANISKRRWSKERSKELTEQGAYELLRSLPDLDEEKGQIKSKHELLLDGISQELTSGYLEKRFKDKEDWEGSFDTLYTFQQAVIENAHDLKNLKKYLNLQTGKYQKVGDEKSIFYISNFLARRAINPKMEEYFVKGFEMTAITEEIASVLDKEDDYAIYSKSFFDREIQYDFAVNVFAIGENPSVGPGNNLYQQMIISAAETGFIDVAHKNVVDYKKLASKPVSGLIIDVAKQSLEHNERYLEYLKFFANIVSTEEISFTELHSEEDLTPEYLFILKALNNATDKARKFKEKLGISSGKKEFLKKAEYFSDQISDQLQENSVVIPFNQQGLRGFFVTTTSRFGVENANDKKEVVRRIGKLISTHKIDKRWNIFKQSEISLTSLNVGTPNGMFVLVDSEYTEKPLIETVLDVCTPSVYRRESIGTLKENVELRYKIPRNFTQMPTLSGYEYDFAEHEQLRGVVKSVLIQKLAMGGIGFKASFVDSENLASSVSDTVVTGKVGFPQSRVEVEFDGDARSLPNDLQWFVENLTLKLVNETCCVPIGENELISMNVLTSEEARERKIESIPGRVVHVGGYRMTGDRKQFTEQAEANFRSAMSEMGTATGGLSLALVNVRHREKYPECERFLTWNVGYEPDPPPPPAKRKPPKHLLPNS